MTVQLSARQASPAPKTADLVQTTVAAQAAAQSAVAAGNGISVTLSGSTNTIVWKRSKVLVSALPAASSHSGEGYLVSDANSTTFGGIVAGSGTNIVPVYSDGTNWRIG